MNATKHLNIWSAFRQKSTATGDHPKRNAARKDIGRTIPQMLIRSFIKTNLVSPPPRTIHVSTGISYAVPMQVTQSTSIKLEASDFVSGLRSYSESIGSLSKFRNTLVSTPTDRKII